MPNAFLFCGWGWVLGRNLLFLIPFIRFRRGFPLTVGPVIVFVHVCHPLPLFRFQVPEGIAPKLLEKLMGKYSANLLQENNFWYFPSPVSLIPFLLYLFRRGTWGKNMPFSLLFCSISISSTLPITWNYFSPEMNHSKVVSQGCVSGCSLGFSLGARSWHTSVLLF